MKRPKKWQQDKRFCAWIVSVEYARHDGKKTKPLLTEGACVYMWEAWLASLTFTKGDKQ